MLNYIEMSKLWQLQMEMEDCEEKESLNTVLFEYKQYTDCGTVKECRNRKEWFSMTLEQIMRNTDKIIDGLREEVERIRAEAEESKTTKRGRPAGGEKSITVAAKVGNKVWIIIGDEAHEFTVEHIDIWGKDHTYYCKNEKSSYCFEFEEFGTLAFSSKKKAMDALKRMVKK